MDRERQAERQQRVQAHPEPEAPDRPMTRLPKAGETRRLAGVFAVVAQLGVVEAKNRRARFLEPTHHGREQDRDSERAEQNSGCAGLLVERPELVQIVETDRDDRQRPAERLAIAFHEHASPAELGARQRLAEPGEPWQPTRDAPAILVERRAELITEVRLLR